MERDAIVDASGLYRYWLERRWDAALPILGFVMLNPSTADAWVDDPTIRRCLGFAQQWGFGSLVVTNLFAYRATRPADLWAAVDPVGTDNDRYLVQMAQQVQRIVVAWGNLGQWGDRAHHVNALLNPNGGRVLYTLGLTQRQQPRHPLYSPKATKLIRWASPWRD